MSPAPTEQPRRDTMTRTKLVNHSSCRLRVPTGLREKDEEMVRSSTKDRLLSSLPFKIYVLINFEVGKRSKLTLTQDTHVDKN